MTIYGSIFKYIKRVSIKKLLIQKNKEYFNRY